MTRKQALDILALLLIRSCDCDCGNHHLYADDIEAIRLLLKEDEEK